MADKGAATDALSRATECLSRDTSIGMVRTHYNKYPRFILLNVQNMFGSLVMLYTNYFTRVWRDLQLFMEAHTESGPPTPTTAARIYVSCWFHDLYVSNREAVKKICATAFNKHYRDELVHISREYDHYLSMLNASIRPTHIKFALEDTLFIPYMSETFAPEEKRDNPFSIDGYLSDEVIFYGLMHIFKDRKLMRVSQLCSDTLGRPCWLFDWHTHYRVCAWFHMEGNFTEDDVTLAYVLGVNCTRRLGPRDVDDPQPFPDNIVAPAELNPADYARLTARRFYGSYEVRTVEVAGKRKVTRASKKRKAGMEVGAAEKTVEVEEEVMSEFRIIDWTYYYLNVLKYDGYRRNAAFLIIVKED